MSKLNILFILLLSISCLLFTFNAQEEQQKQEIDEGEKHTFQTEVSKMMKIIIHSLYTNKEIFLRELISNAADALDKVRFLSVTDDSIKQDFNIKISLDIDAATITIQDTGIGMSKDELIKNLGTIAKSGTSEFIKNLESSDDKSLIGQFGVGFYSAFLVADKVRVYSKSYKVDETWIWESDGTDAFTIIKDEDNSMERGTKIVLMLKDKYFLDEKVIEDLVKKYSEFIDFPIMLYKNKKVEKEVVDEEGMQKEAEKQADEKIKEAEENGEALEKTREELIEEIKSTMEVRHKIDYDIVPEFETVNVNKPIWMRNEKEVTEEEYNNFYKSITKKNEDPLTHVHFSAEGDSNFRALLFVPKTAKSLYEKVDTEEEKNYLKLYVRRVFITGDLVRMLPSYMRFVRGVIDSDDLPLNVGRELVQESRHMDRIKRKLVRKILNTLIALSEENKELYDEFYKAYSSYIKLGVIEDIPNRQKLSKMLKYYTSYDKTKQSTFDEYVSRMKEGQKEIYFITADSVDAAENSPLIEKLLSEGYEVIYMTESIDESCVMSMERYNNDYKLVNVGTEGVKIGEQDEENKKLQKEEFDTLIKSIKEILSEKVEKVELSQTLTDTPAVVVSPERGITANMEKLMKLQAYATQKNPQINFKKVLLLNSEHEIIKNLNIMVSKGLNDSEEFKKYIGLLYDTALLHSGYDMQNTKEFANFVYSMMDEKISKMSDEKEEEDTQQHNEL